MLRRGKKGQVVQCRSLFALFDAEQAAVNTVEAQIERFTNNASILGSDNYLGGLFHWTPSIKKNIVAFIIIMFLPKGHNSGK